MHNFRAARPGETIVFGAERPGYPETTVDSGEVDRWLAFMLANGIRRVCCLLDGEQLAYYAGLGLLQRYREAFGASNVCHAPVADYRPVPGELLAQTILPFLQDAKTMGEPVVVHCSAGVGRTGQVLRAWCNTP